MIDKPEGKAVGGDGDKNSALLQFLSSFEALPRQLADAMIRQAPDEQKALLKIYGDALHEQVQGLCSHIRVGASTLGHQGQKDVARFVADSGAAVLVSGARSLTSDVSSVAARVGISSLVEEIKKIINELWTLITGSPPPGWFLTLEQIIDELINFLLSAGWLRLASALSRMHQNYLNEMILLARRKRESAAFAKTEVDDSDLGGP